MPLRPVYSPLEQTPPLPWEVDIIAVHGLNPRLKTDREQAEGTWSKGKRMWLRDDLPQCTPHARIFIYQWNAAALIGQDYSTFQDKANEFLEAIATKRIGSEDLPLVLLGHSLGGLLIEQALINASIFRRFKSIGNATVGIAFFATPHSGGNENLVNIGKLAADIINQFRLKKKKSLIENLHKDSKSNDTIQQQWKELAEKWTIISFWGSKDDMVPRGSAYFNFSSGESVIKLDADHSGVCKFDTKNDETDQDNWELVSVHMSSLYKDSVERGQANAAAKEAAKPMKNSYVKDESYKRCLRTLHVTDPSDNLTRIQKSKDELLGGTCSWIHDDPAYVAFTLEEQSQTFWVHGNPGKGKTMLAISQVFHLQEKLKSTPDTLCYFFCDDKDDRKKGAVAILQSLLHQILDRHPKSFEVFRVDWERQEEKLITGPDAQVTLWRIFESVLLSLKGETIWFVIDALDECEETTRTSLLEDIVKHIDSLDDVTEKWLFTSRNESSIKEPLLDSKEISLESNEKAVTADVQLYIDKKVESLTGRPKYLQFSGLLDLKKDITKTLQEKSEGTFLWVSLACKQLEKQPPVSAIDVLKRLPSDLDKLYAQLLNVILADEYNLELVKDILVLVTIALRPLTLYEIALLASLDEKYRNDKGAIRQYVEKCGSFITIREDSIHLVHQSAKDFLTSKKALSKLDLSTDLSKEHKMMTIRCLDYVCSGIFDDGAYDLSCDQSSSASDEAEHDLTTIEDEAPSTEGDDTTHIDCAPVPLRYPILSWLAHASSASPDIEDYFNRREDFFEMGSLSRTAWEETCESMNQGLPNMPILHLATQFNIVPLVAKIIEWNQYLVDMKDSYGHTALTRAVDEGNLRLVQLLLSKGANVNKQGAKYRPLQYAIRNGHTGISRHLLECGADLRVHDGRTELHWAAWGGKEEIARLLLEKGADVSAQSEDGDTPLHEAAYAGHENTTRLLLKWKADISAVTKFGLTPLAKAVLSQQPRAVSVLIAHKADVNERSNGVTLLHRAITGGDKTIVNLLLNAGADPNLRNGLDPELSRAVEKGNEEIVSLLLKKGADINATRERGGDTALHEAARYGRSRMISLLLAHGAHIDSRNSDGDEALHVAAVHGNKEAIGALLDHGANINSRWEREWRGSPVTVLHRALHGAQSGEVVKLLLERGISVTSDDFGTIESCSVKTVAEEKEMGVLLRKYGLHTKIKKKKPNP